MTINEFIEKFVEAAELENASNIEATTVFRELDDWNSLAALSVLSMFEDELDKEITVDAFKKASTIQDLYNLAQ